MTRRTLTALLLFSFAGAANAQTPNTDIFLAPLHRIGDSITVGTPVNVTHRDGYDNQPAFTRDSRAILYVAQSEGQTDIWRYDLASKRTTRVTNTPESEYSPTPVPAENRFSVIRVERDSAQRLWTFAMDGRTPRLVLPSLPRVGYHAWLHDGRIAAYQLGTPSTLHLVSANGARDTVIARDIGRAIQPLARESRSLLSYTQRDSAGAMRIMVFTGRTQQRRFAHDMVRVGLDGRAIRSSIVDSVVTVALPAVGRGDFAAGQRVPCLDPRCDTDHRDRVGARTMERRRRCRIGVAAGRRPQAVRREKRLASGRQPRRSMACLRRRAGYEVNQDGGERVVRVLAVSGACAPRHPMARFSVPRHSSRRQP
jgi:Periplasmic component of the Tol biopolymer transport system